MNEDSGEVRGETQSCNAARVAYRSQIIHCFGNESKVCVLTPGLENTQLRKFEEYNSRFRNMFLTVKIC